MSMAECKQAVLVEKETAHRDCLTGCYDKMTIQYLVDSVFFEKRRAPVPCDVCY